MVPTTAAQPEFDEFAADYHAALNQGLRFTGEQADYFAEKRCQWTAQKAQAAGLQVKRILDFGCGTGTATRFLLKAFPGAEVTGCDPSAASLEVARADHAGLPSTFILPEDLPGQAPFDLAYCNGVFHHIPPQDRAAAAHSVQAALKPGGCFAFWENNPWNPMVWWIMSRVPFDRDAIMLWPGEASDLLAAAGLSPAEARYLFVFPSALAFLRPLEAMLTPLPTGGQYVVWAAKP